MGTVGQNSIRILDRLADYSDESLLTELRRVANVVGRNSLTIQDIENHARCSYAILKQRFGGLNHALKVLGLSAREHHRNISDTELLRELARIWDVVLTHEGRRPHKDDLVKFRSKFSQGPYYRRWGSWIKACEALLAWEAEPGNCTGDPSAEAIPVQNEVGSPQLLGQVPKRKRTIPLRVRYAILLRDRFACQICGRSPSSVPGLEVDVDHIISEHKGGTLDPQNLRCLCKDCNLGKGSYSELGGTSDLFKQ